jgi:predicted GIY-YIG superfamily endonuclease
MDTLTCYCIISENNNRTYVGATNNFSRRIRQHNREITGGAKATSGFIWKPLMLINGFNNRNELLSFEWHFKHVKNLNIKGGKERRIKAINKLLEDEKWNNLRINILEEIYDKIIFINKNILIK